MDDLISRKALLSKVLKEKFEYFGIDLTEPFRKTVTAKVLAAPAVPKRDGYSADVAVIDCVGPGWIPCSERLPEINGRLKLVDQISDEVLATDSNGNIRHVYLTNCGYSGPTFCTVEEGMSVDVLAWMPLPEPYREEADV